VPLVLVLNVVIFCAFDAFFWFYDAIIISVILYKKNILFYSILYYVYDSHYN